MTDLTKPMQGRTIEGGEDQYKKLTPVFQKPHEGWSCESGVLSRTVRNTRPVAKDDPETETRFHQELYNPYVRNRTYDETVKPDDTLFDDMMIQLKAAQETAVFFENEARVNKEDSDMWYRYYLDAIKVRRELQVENDKLKTGGLWKRFWKFLDARDGDI